LEEEEEEDILRPVSHAGNRQASHHSSRASTTCDWSMQSRDSHVTAGTGDCTPRMPVTGTYRHARQSRVPVTGIRGMESPVPVTGTLATIAPVPAATCDWLMQ